MPHILDLKKNRLLEVSPTFIDVYKRQFLDRDFTGTKVIVG